MSDLEDAARDSIKKSIDESTEASRSPSFQRLYLLQHTLSWKSILPLLDGIYQADKMPGEVMAGLIQGGLSTSWQRAGESLGIKDATDFPAKVEAIPVPGGGEGIAILVGWGEPPCTPLCSYQLYVFRPGGGRVLMAERSPEHLRKSTGIQGVVCEWKKDGKRLGYRPTRLTRDDFIVAAVHVLTGEIDSSYDTVRSKTENGYKVKFNDKYGMSAEVDLAHPDDPRPGPNPPGPER